MFNSIIWVIHNVFSRIRGLVVLKLCRNCEQQVYLFRMTGIYMWDVIYKGYTLYMVIIGTECNVYVHAP